MKNVKNKRCKRFINQKFIRSRKARIKTKLTISKLIMCEQ